MEITEQQLAKWNTFKSGWISRVRPAVQKTLLTAEVARDFQAWLDMHGVLFPTVFNQADSQKITDLIDKFNRCERAIAKVEEGVYGLKFYDGKIDIIAPTDMPAEEYSNDVVTFEGALIWVGVIGVVVVSAIIATSLLIETIAGDERIRLAEKMLDAADEINDMSPEMQAAFKELVEENEEKLKEAGILDKLLGGGSGMLIAGAIAAGILLFAYLRRRD